MFVSRLKFPMTYYKSFSRVDFSPVYAEVGMSGPVAE